MQAMDAIDVRSRDTHDSETHQCWIIDVSANKRSFLPWKRKRSTSSRDLDISSLSQSECQNLGSAMQNQNVPGYMCHCQCGSASSSKSPVTPRSNSPNSQSPGSSYMKSNKKLHALLEEMNQTEEQRLREILTESARYPRNRSNGLSTRDDTKLTSIPNRSSSMSRYELSTQSGHLSQVQQSARAPRRSMALVSHDRAAELESSFELFDTHPVHIDRLPLPLPKDHLASILHIPDTNPDNGRISRQPTDDDQSQRSSTTLVELDALRPMVELPEFSEQSKKLDLWTFCHAGYGDKKFRTLPGEAYPI